MAKTYAVRNISLCTKDCLCLYVCPTGASDTENSVIDKDKCIGCSACASACPSKAISMVPREYPPQQKHSDDVISAMRILLESKANQENIASSLSGKLAKAIEKSNRIMAEDIIRESGYMLPQSGNARIFLEKILSETQDESFPSAEVQKLLSLIKTNEATPIPQEKWKCKICGHIHEGSITDDFTCPICKQPASVFAKV
ncbi:MAG: 4Fe-4S binding protein [Bacillota bacterium]